MSKCIHWCACVRMIRSSIDSRYLVTIETEDNLKTAMGCNGCLESLLESDICEDLRICRSCNKNGEECDGTGCCEDVINLLLMGDIS